jgi:hemolysin III
MKGAMRSMPARERRWTIDAHGRPIAAGRDYDRTEITADAVVHGVGLTLGILGVAFLVALVIRSPWNGSLAGALVYAVGLLAMLVCSAAYNLWPVSRMKWLLRRFDHSAIYLLIAATYTPFMAQLKQGPLAATMLALVWAIAAVGIVMKLALPGRFDRLSILLYLLLSWSGVMMYDVIAALPASTLWLLGAGGLLYTFGVLFHLWSRLRFQNVVWHSFVVVAAACHYAAVLDYLGRA